MKKKKIIFWDTENQRREKKNEQMNELCVLFLSTSACDSHGHCCIEDKARKYISYIQVSHFCNRGLMTHTTTDGFQSLHG